MNQAYYKNFINNPHEFSGVKSGLYCWRINGSNNWSEELFASEDEAFEDAKKSCLGIGRHTIHFGVTNSKPVDSKEASDAIKQFGLHTLEDLAGNYTKILRALAVPEHNHTKVKTEISDSITAILTEAYESSLKTTIHKTRHKYHTIKQEDIGIYSTDLSGLLSDLREQYQVAKWGNRRDWVKVEDVKKLTIKKAKEVIKKSKLPLTIDVIAIFQGIEFDRTRERLHILCNESVSKGRFLRDAGSILCTKNHKKVDAGDWRDPPICLACFERLTKLNRMS